MNPFIYWIFLAALVYFTVQVAIYKSSEDELAELLLTRFIETKKGQK